MRIHVKMTYCLTFKYNSLNMQIQQNSYASNLCIQSKICLEQETLGIGHTCIRNSYKYGVGTKDLIEKRPTKGLKKPNRTKGLKKTLSDKININFLLKKKKKKSKTHFLNKNINFLIK